MNFGYINIKNVYPYDRHLIDGLIKNGHQVHELSESSPGLAKYKNVAGYVRAHKANTDVFIIGYPAPLYAILVSLITRKKVIFNAVSSQYEANVISRGIPKYSFKALKSWLIDFVSFHLSTKILLETQAQVRYVHRLCFVSYKKLVPFHSGVIESDFYFDPTIKKKENFTVLFRGRFLPESGIDTVIKAAHLLERKGIDFRIIGHGFMHKEVTALMTSLEPKNVEIISTRLPISELRHKMLECHVSLGQLADHPRLLRTVPCKLYETIAMKMPYVTGRNKPVFELLTEGESCVCVNPGDPNDLARALLELKEKPEILEKVAARGYEIYKQKLASEHTAHRFINEVLA